MRFCEHAEQFVGETLPYLRHTRKIQDNIPESFKPH